MGSTNTIVLNTFVVEFTDATDVTQGTQTFIAAEGSHAVAVTNAGLDSSVVGVLVIMDGRGVRPIIPPIIWGMVGLEWD